MPQAGVRLNIADLTDGTLPHYVRIVDINDHGDLVGHGGPGDRPPEPSQFLLQRVAAGSAPSVNAPARRHPSASPALAAARLAALRTLDAAMSRENRVRR